MFVIAAVTLVSLLHPGPRTPPQVTHRLYGLAGWRISVNHDTFTGAVSCSLTAKQVHFKSDTLIFHIGPGVEATHAVFRLDGGAPRAVSTVFREDEAHGFFPQRGWIDNPAGGDVALPANQLKGVKRLWIRASTSYVPQYFNISRFDDALAGAKAAGCPDNAFGAA
jgi:hypothetical protein